MTARGTRRTAWLTGLLSLLALALAVPASADDPKYSDEKLKKMVKAQLRKQGLTPKGVSNCRPKRGGKVMVCKWRAEGLWPGEVAYECVGKARLVVRGKKWKIDPCNNLREGMVPLLPFPGPHPVFGYNEDWIAQAGRLDTLAAGGAEVARTGMYWDAVEQHSPDGRRWVEFDGIYALMRSLGIRPLWVLQAAPCWAQAGDCQRGSHPSADHFDEFAAFATRVAERYPDSLGLEVWNEPNWGLYWGGTPDPYAYGEMVGAVASAVHAAKPGMPVITAGLSPHINNEGDAIAYEHFLRLAYQTGGPQQADAIGAHPYPNRRYVEDYLGNIRVNLYRYLRVMGEFGDDGKPIWVTETGTSTTEDDGFNADQQADALAKMYTQFRRIENIPVVIYHRFVDQPGYWKSNERGFGVLEPGGNRKPAYCAVAAARERPC
jgi:Cellulase (glycosyl hydrolase family 5)